MLRLWQASEPLLMRMWRVRTVRDGSILQYGISPFRGQSTVLADGTQVPHGARILHLHLDNRRVALALKDSHGNVWALGPRLDADLDHLAIDVCSGRVGSVAAVRGVTVLASMAPRFGFEVRPLPRNLRWRLIQSLAGLVIASYHAAGRAEIKRGVAWPGEIWMSARALRERVQGEP
ncbi:MAG TPA: hypothetical protein VEN12_04195 [Verrucomicrobiae bacterium]|nr:hypothetical protein [Verrucomicrobiae bacterium]